MILVIRLKREYLTPEVKNKCDLSTLQIEPTSYVGEDLKVHCSDITYRIELKDKVHCAYVYVLIEHQSTPMKLMPFRILKYQIAIIQDHLKTHEKDTVELLPLVVPIVFYNGMDSPYPYELDIAEIFADKELFTETQLGKFKLVDLTVADNSEILKHGKVAVLEMLAKHIYVRDLRSVINELVSALVAGHQDKLSKSLFKSAFTYLATSHEQDELLELRDMIIKELPYYKEQVMTYAESLIQEGIKKGIEKGMEKGKHEAQVEIAQQLLESGIDESIISKVTHLNPKELAELKINDN